MEHADLIRRRELRARYSNDPTQSNRITSLKSIIETRSLPCNDKWYESVLFIALLDRTFSFSQAREMVQAIDGWFEKKVAEECNYFNPAGNLIEYMEQLENELREKIQE